MPDQQEDFLPDRDRVIKEIQVGPPPGAAADLGGPQAAGFTILRTDEMDEYEPQIPRDILEATATAGPALSENFAGTDRKAAKISIAHGDTEDFADLGALIDSLTPDDDMINHDPEITRDEHSDRVEEELRNVRVKAWIYAASREKDNDFHTIIGTDPAQPNKRFMNAEVSGLPSKKSAAFAKIKSARDSFKQIVNNNTPGFGYDFYKPPRPITMEGSLFFDITHASGGHPGPSKAKPESIWEVHPVTSLTPRTP